MNDRVKGILSDVRLNLKEVSVANIQDGEIFDAAGKVQNDILLRLGGVERSFKVKLTLNQIDYDFANENTYDFNNFFTSWNGELIYKKNIEWNEYKHLNGEHPLYFTIFASKLYFSPKPSSSDDYVEFWGTQYAVINDMDADVEPEIPKVCDDALILGICARFNAKDFTELYELKLSALPKLDSKTSKSENKCRW